jgi:hypothetical protein
MRFIFLLLILFSSNVYAGTSAFTAGSGALTDQHIGYGSSTNKIKGESAFFYNDSTNTMSVDNFTLRSNGNLRLSDADNSNYVELKSPAVVGTNRTFTLPDSYGTAGQFLKTDGAGVMSWDTASGGGGGGGNPNLIINGGMDIWQRGTTIAGISTGTFSADRWRFFKSSSSTFDAIRSTDVPSGSGLLYSHRIDVTGADASVDAGDLILMRYPMEGFDVSKIIGKQITISFYVKSPKTGTHCFLLERNGGSDLQYSTTYSVASANTWERKEITLTMPGPSGFNLDNQIGLSVNFTLMVGSTYRNLTANSWGGPSNNYGHSGCTYNLFDNTANDFFITGVQLEVGSSASDFKTRGETIAEEYRLARRYFSRHKGDGGANTNITFGPCSRINDTRSFCNILNYNSPMRNTPTLSIDANGLYVIRSSGSAYSVSSMILQSNTFDNSVNFHNGHMFDVTHGSDPSGQAGHLQLSLGTGFIQLNAEL